MKPALLYGKNDLRVVDVDIPEIGFSHCFGVHISRISPLLMVGLRIQYHDPSGR